MRIAFVQELTTLAQKNPNIILLTADLGFTVFEDFAKKFPKQFFNIGVGESNLVCVAAGMALSGKIVFAYSIATFATFRPFEFIRNDVCMHNAHVIIVGSGAGLSYGNAGPTHFATQDIAIMRSIPNLTILCPADQTETHWATREAVNLKRPVYLRLGKRGEPPVHTNRDTKLEFGKGKLIKNGGEIAILATGNIVYNALEATRILNNDGIKTTLFSIHTVKPIDKQLVKKLALSKKTIITVEEHSVIGGLGSAVAEILSQIGTRQARLEILAIDDSFPERLGAQTFMRETHGLSPQNIAKKISEL